MSDDEYDDQWRCSVCRRWFVVPVLARDHESTCESSPGGAAGR